MNWYRAIKMFPALAGLLIATGCVVDTPHYTNYGVPHSHGIAASGRPANTTPVSYTRSRTQQSYGGDASYREEPIWNTYEGVYGVEAVLLMTQNGEPERAILEFIAASNFPFDPTAEEINYLFQEGVSSRVVVAMVERGEDIMEESGLAPNAEIVNEGLTVGTAPAPAPAPPAQELLDGGLPNVRTDYYQELAPHGEWIYVSNYGWSWRPRVALSTVSWRPYFDNGHWLHSDVGWYWQSNYSWGWLPFHYGRWSHHGAYGWIWHPGDVWGPAWVSWRVHSGHYGWAPLPYYSTFSPAFGFSYRGRRVGADFGFGLTSFHYSFIPRRHFGLRGFHGHRVRGRAHYDCFYGSQVHHHYHYHSERRAPVNQGINVREVERETGREIQRAALRKADVDVMRRPAGRSDGGGATPVVYRPETPDGQGVRARVATPRSEKFASTPAGGTGLSRGLTSGRSAAQSNQRANASSPRRSTESTASARSSGSGRSAAPRASTPSGLASNRSVSETTRSTGAPTVRNSASTAATRGASSQRSFASPGRSAAPRSPSLSESQSRSSSGVAVANRSAAPRRSNSIPVQSSVMGRDRQSTTRDISSPAANSSQSYRYGLNQGSLNSYRSSVAARNSSSRSSSSIANRNASSVNSRSSGVSQRNAAPSRNAASTPRSSSSAATSRAPSVSQRRSVSAPSAAPSSSRANVAPRSAPSSPAPSRVAPSRPSTPRAVAPSRSTPSTPRSAAPSRSTTPSSRSASPSRSSSSPSSRSISGGFGSSSRSTSTPSRAMPSRGASSSRSR